MSIRGRYRAMRSGPIEEPFGDDFDKTMPFASKQEDALTDPEATSVFGPTQSPPQSGPSAVPSTPPPSGPPPDMQTTITVELTTEDLSSMLDLKEAMLARAKQTLLDAEKRLSEAQSERDNTEKLLASSSKGVMVYARAMLLN